MKKYYRPDEIAEMMDVTTRTVYNWIAAGEVDFIKIRGTLRIVLRDPDDLEALKRKNCENG